MFNLKKKKENPLPEMQGVDEPLQNIDETGVVSQEKEEDASQEKEGGASETIPEKLDEIGESSQSETEDSAQREDSDMMSAFEAWLEDSMPEAERREAAKSAMNLVRGAIGAGEYDDAIFDVISKGADYDRAIAEASSLAEAKGREEGMAEGRRSGFEEGLEKGFKEGEVKGRNAGIDEYFEKNRGDGVPHPGSGSSRRPPHAPSIFDLARSAF